MHEAEFITRLSAALNNVLEQIDKPEGMTIFVEMGLSTRPGQPDEITINTGCTVDEKTRTVHAIEQFLVEKPQN